MTSKKAAKSRVPHPLSGWKIWKAAVRELRHGWKGYAAILAVVAVPLDLLGTVASIASDPSFNAYAQIAAVIMNVALIWAIIEYQRTGIVPKPHTAYYDGSVATIRFIIVTLFVVLMLIPAAIGGMFLYAGIVAAQSVGSPAEVGLITTVCLIFASPSIWLVTRFGLGSVIAVATGMRPIAALRYSRSLTMGRFWRVLGRYAQLALYLIVLVALPIAFFTAVLSALKFGQLAVLFFELITTFTALPLANSYFLRLYRDLETKPAPAPETPAELKAELVAEDA